MSGLEPAIRSILSRAADWHDRGAGSHATLRLWMLLEMHNCPAEYMVAEYEYTLPVEVRLAPFGDDEQSEVTMALCHLAASPPLADARISYLSALSAALPWIGLEPVVKLLLERPDPEWDDEAVRQVLIALDFMLQYVWMTEEDPRYAHLRTLSEIVTRFDLASVMDGLAEHNNARVSEPAGWIVKRLGVLRGRSV